MRMNNNHTDRLYQLFKNYVLKAYSSDVHKLFLNYKYEMSFLYQLNQKIQKTDEDEIIDQKNEIYYFNTDNEWRIRQHDLSLSLSKCELLKLIQMFVDTMEQFFHIGAIVDFKKEYLTKMISSDKVENARFVVTERFITAEDIDTYFPFGAKIYPFGNVGTTNSLYFTAPLVEKIKHEGYSDDLEDAFEINMKQDLVYNKMIPSIAFADDAVRQKLYTIIRGGESK